MTQMPLVRIDQGPSKFDLMLSLFDGNKTPRRTALFLLEDGRMVNVAITEIQQEDGSGESWNFGGTGTFGAGKIGFRVKGYFSTNSSRGSLRLGD